jgi:hypothetical protein
LVEWSVLKCGPSALSVVSAAARGLDARADFPNFIGDKGQYGIKTVLFQILRSSALPFEAAPRIDPKFHRAHEMRGLKL